MPEAPPIVSWLHVTVVGHGHHGVYGRKGGTEGAGYTGYGAGITMGGITGRASSSRMRRSSSSMRCWVESRLGIFDLLILLTPFRSSPAKSNPQSHSERRSASPPCLEPA